MSIIYKRLEATRKLYKRGENPYINQPDGVERIIYAVDMDFDGLAELARKAAANKSGKSRFGPLTVEVIKRERMT
jgi:hypothetical protein